MLHKGNFALPCRTPPTPHLILSPLVSFSSTTIQYTPKALSPRDYIGDLYFGSSAIWEILCGGELIRSYQIEEDFSSWGQGVVSSLCMIV